MARDPDRRPRKASIAPKSRTSTPVSASASTGSSTSPTAPSKCMSCATVPMARAAMNWRRRCMATPCSARRFSRPGKSRSPTSGPPRFENLPVLGHRRLTHAVAGVATKANPLPSPFFVLATQNPIEQEGGLPAARGTARPLHVRHPHQLPQAARGAGDRQSDDGRRCIQRQ